MKDWLAVRCSGDREGGKPLRLHNGTTRGPRTHSDTAVAVLLTAAPVLSLTRSAFVAVQLTYRMKARTSRCFVNADTTAALYRDAFELLAGATLESTYRR